MKKFHLLLYFILEFREVLAARFTSRDQSTCKGRYKLCHINQMCQTTTWKETCIKLNKHAECRFWADIYEIYGDFHSARIISLQEKKTLVETISVAITDSSNVQYFDLYLINIFTKSAKTERRTDKHYVQADTLLGYSRKTNKQGKWGHRISRGIQKIGCGNPGVNKKKKLNFQGWSKKKLCQNSMGFIFSPWEFQWV